MTNLADLLVSTATTYPDRTAIVFGDSRLTYAQLDGASNPGRRRHAHKPHCSPSAKD